MKYKDYYDILGLDKNADQDEIKRAYKKLARKYHPDVSKMSDAEARFKELGEAYEVLKDPQKREAYDQLGSNWQANQEFTPPPHWQREFEFGGSDNGGGAFSDFFESLFGGHGGGEHFRQGFGPGSRFHGQGRDIHASIAISLEDAYHGVTPTLTLEHSGRSHTLKVRIPAGVRPGQQIRLAGQGGAGAQGHPKGDLYLDIQIKPHPLYTVQGKDVYLQLPVAPWEAALGGKVKVPTPRGEVDLTLPAASASGRKLRLKGRGIPANEPGDFYVILQVVLPAADTPQAQEFYRQMARTLAFEPRQHLYRGERHED